MQLPITIALHRSFRLGAALLSAHLLAMVVVALPGWPSEIVLFLLVGAGASMLVSWHQWQLRIGCLRLYHDGQIECRLVGRESFVSAELLRGTTIHPWLTVLRLETAEGRIVVTILPDSMVAEDFRRLRLWMRWRADVSGRKDAA